MTGMKSENGLPTILGTFVYLKMNGKTLMLHRNKKKTDFLYSKYVAPGGKIEVGETPEQCVRREFNEETDLRLNGELNYRGAVLFDNKKRNFNGKPAEFNFIVHVFEAYSYEGELKDIDPKGTPEWVDDEKLYNLPMEKGDFILMDVLRKGEKLNHIIYLEDDNVRVEIAE